MESWIFYHIFILLPHLSPPNLHNAIFIVKCGLCNLSAEIMREWKYPYGKPLYTLDSLRMRAIAYIVCICIGAKDSTVLAVFGSFVVQSTGYATEIRILMWRRLRYAVARQTSRGCGRLLNVNCYSLSEPRSLILPDLEKAQLILGRRTKLSFLMEIWQKSIFIRSIWVWCKSEHRDPNGELWMLIQFVDSPSFGKQMFVHRRSMFDVPRAEIIQLNCRQIFNQIYYLKKKTYSRNSASPACG